MGRSSVALSPEGKTLLRSPLLSSFPTQPQSHHAACDESDERTKVKEPSLQHRVRPPPFPVNSTSTNRPTFNNSRLSALEVILLSTHTPALNIIFTPFAHVRKFFFLMWCNCTGYGTKIVPSKSTSWGPLFVQSTMCTTIPKKIHFLSPIMCNPK
jgi:hypothetical protein